ncbi:hypothetical protein SERLADRAFT_417493 [Serpula lacrymans var. lacrymans S7.9]|uniref:Adenosine deaminase n=1 Tax=Serpula lacrymans var. lacrymans (strain S7.9) TaxID=578457 RepID=F8P6L7_SERL9|nr:uncharacterized protein SERLADRAFT_417493 [Serpula lacrymans var. lacrymans S7.9]EGO21083.1 hypothetical protein SERLADRAFT_417493 [Serpula lacrymans var. lacrymans S7.9]
MPSLEEYAAKRAALMKTDRGFRIDHAKSASESATEIEADRIIRQIREIEAKSIWSAEHDNIPHPFPGMEFLTGKTPTRHVTVNASTLLKLALQQSAIHIRVPTPVSIGVPLSAIVPDFSVQHHDFHAEFLSLCDVSYVPNAWVSLRKAREMFSPTLGGPDGFEQWIIGALSINATEAYLTHNTNAKIWKKFTDAIALSSVLLKFTLPPMKLVYYAPIWSAYIRQFLVDNIADGVSYIELFIRYMFGADGREDVPHRDWLVAFDQDLHDEGRDDDFFGAKIIYTAIKTVEPAGLDWYLEDCIALKQEFPYLVAGFDLVGDENLLRPLIDYLEPFLRFEERKKELGLDIPFIFHAGETCGDGTVADNNLYDAILLGTKRIGHGFSLVKHPSLLQICREKGILVEVCPISYEILRLTSSMPMHPLPVLVNNGIPVALSSDDPAVFGNMGLTYDFFQVLVASEITGLIMLGHFARDSITYSTLNDTEKSLVMGAWEKRWAKFVKEIVEFSEDLQ